MAGGSSHESIESDKGKVWGHLVPNPFVVKSTTEGGVAFGRAIQDDDAAFIRGFNPISDVRGEEESSCGFQRRKTWR